MKNLLDEFNHSADLKCYMDSSAARGICHRVGVGKLKHLEVKDLWLQEKTQAKQLSVQWIPRKANPSDYLTHPITKATEIQEFHKTAGLWTRGKEGNTDAAGTDGKKKGHEREQSRTPSDQ